MALNLLETRPIFYIDLEAKTPQVYEFLNSADLQACLDEDNLNHWRDLNSYDFKVFDNEAKAEAWLAEYKAASKKLMPLSKRPKDVPCMLLKRRYMIQTLMREKMQTYRHYRKPWDKGQLFCFQDQSYGLIVRLLSIKETSDGFRYDFELP